MILKIADIPTAYINLEKDSEKRESVEKEIRSLGINSFSRVDAILGEKPDTRFAVARSHSKAVSSFTQTPFLVLEDDAVVINPAEHLEVPDDADIVLLGIWDEKVLKRSNGMRFEHGKVYESFSDSLVKAYKMNGMHAVLYVSDHSVKIAQKVFSLSPKTGRHIDNLFRDVTPFLNVYALKIPVFAQTSKLEYTKITIKESSIYKG